jgi:serine protease
MKLARLVIPVALLLSLVPLSGGGDTPVEKYLVATRARPAPELIGSFAKTGRDARVFRSVDGFAATLTADEVRALRRHPDVLFVEKDPPRRLFRDAASGTSPFPAAEASTQQIPYGVAMINAPPMWALTRGTGVRVGIADTGIDLAHPDLEANIAGGRSFLPGVSSFHDEGDHGTHVAGTVGSLDNDFGVVGVAPEAQLYSLRVFLGDGSSDSDFANASAVIHVIDWAIENGVKVLNMSFGGPESSELERQSLLRARQNDIFVAVAVGNTGNTTPQYPASYPGAFGVGSVDARGQIASSSTRGSFVKVVAPGVNVRSTVPEVSSRSLLVVDSVLGGLEGSLLFGSPRGALSGEWVPCGIGRPEDFPSDMSGRVALIERGELLFADKAKNAKAAGAGAVVIYNNEPGLFNGTLGNEPFAWPLTVGISQESGQALLDRGGSTFVTSSFQPYAFSSGTSMASPHVAGAAALLRALVPGTTSAAIENALVSTARDLGDPGYDTTYGHGLIDVHAAARMLAPELFAGRLRPVRR